MLNLPAGKASTLSGHTGPVSLSYRVGTGQKASCSAYLVPGLTSSFFFFHGSGPGCEIQQRWQLLSDMRAGSSLETLESRQG